MLLIERPMIALFLVQSQHLFVQLICPLMTTTSFEHGYSNLALVRKRRRLFWPLPKYRTPWCMLFGGLNHIPVPWSSENNVQSLNCHNHFPSFHLSLQANIFLAAHVSIPNAQSYSQRIRKKNFPAPLPHLSNL